MTNGILKHMEKKQVELRNPLILAYIGDTIYDLYMRTGTVKQYDRNVHDIHTCVCGRVNAHAQALATQRLLPMLTAEELRIFKRGRNAKTATQPKNMDVADYRKATGLEALIGYLFLIGDYSRLEELFVEIGLEN